MIHAFWWLLSFFGVIVLCLVIGVIVALIMFFVLYLSIPAVRRTVDGAFQEDEDGSA